MKKVAVSLTLITIALIAIVILIFGLSHKKQENHDQTKYLAHFLGHQLKEFSSYYNFDEVVNILSSIEKKQTPLLPYEECQRALMKLNYKIFEDKAQQNLQIANQFLHELALKEEIIEIQKGKLYYEIIHQGFGDFITEDSISLLHFIEYNHSGEELQNHQGKIPLKETIPGFRQGVTGMRAGERRKIYMHPDLAYGKLGNYAPQELIIFVVEIKPDQS